LPNHSPNRSKPSSFAMRVRILCDLPGATSELFRYISYHCAKPHLLIEISTISLCQGMVLNLKATDFVGDVFFWNL
jgi:hypothetical protein